MEKEAPFRPGDEVLTDFHRSCVGNVFVVDKVTQYRHCYSGFLVVAHLKGSPERKILGFKKDGIDFPDGIDSTWYKPISINPKTEHHHANEEKGGKEARQEKSPRQEGEAGSQKTGEKSGKEGRQKKRKAEGSQKR